MKERSYVYFSKLFPNNYIPLLLWFSKLNQVWHKAKTVGGNCASHANGMHIYDPSLKKPEKWSVPESPWLHAPRVRSNQIWQIPAISVLGLPDCRIAASAELRSVSAALWPMDYFTAYSPLSTDPTSQASRYSIACSMENILTSYLPWFHQFRCLQVRLTILYIHSFRIPLVMEYVSSGQLLPKTYYIVE